MIETILRRKERYQVNPRSLGKPRRHVPTRHKRSTSHSISPAFDGRTTIALLKRLYLDSRALGICTIDTGPDGLPASGEFRTNGTQLFYMRAVCAATEIRAWM